MSSGPKRVPSNRSATIFGLTTAVWAAVSLLGVFVFALTDHPYRAAVTMGVGVLVIGIARGAWRGRPWFASRNRWSDVLVYTGIGLLIILFAPLVSLGAS